MEKTKAIYLYTKFERFWHWAQALMILFLLVSGFEVHGNVTLLGFRDAVVWHNYVGIAWLVLFVFILFWQFTTGEWKQYIPTTRKLFAVARYYAFGIFKGAAHPVPKSERAKHNPLQRLTYLGMAVVLIPLQMVSGFVFYTYNWWAPAGIQVPLGVVSFVHLAGAFAMLVFLVIHVYMITTGHHPLAHLTAMFTGWEEVEDKS